MLEAVEAELKRQVSRLDQPSVQPFQEMLAYHLGWEPGLQASRSAGKRLRPLILLLTDAACGGDWRTALPAAAAVELVHNFSLVHDDIQDASDTRRGRATVWRKWGTAMAINVGDALFVISSSAILDLHAHVAPELVIEAARLLHESTLELTRGQYLDLSYEKQGGLNIADYWTMIAGKTAALLATSSDLGALLAEAAPARRHHFKTFAHHLGLAFQVQDDVLGIWGDEALTGKSAASDLVAGKKSLPVLLGLEHVPPFAARWRQGPIREDEVSGVAQLLSEAGIRERVEAETRAQMETALAHLEQANAENEAGRELGALARQLVGRRA
jgi:geranylgeranyl diphosphate synthase type I